MNAVFVDTGGWMACADRNDPAHLACTAARDTTLEAGRLLITTDFVIDETLTLIRFRLGLAAANAWWQQIDGSARLRWERVESDRFERARNLFFQYRDKDLSFTDCTSFAIMDAQAKLEIELDRTIFDEKVAVTLAAIEDARASAPWRQFGEDRIM